MKRKKAKSKNHLKGAALIYALILVALVSLISSSFLLIHEINTRHYLNYEKEIRLQDNCLSGLVMIKGQWNTDFDRETVDLFDQQTDSVYLRSYNYGLFKVNHCSAFSYGDTLKRAVLSAPLAFSSALILKQQPYELTLSGRAWINGNIRVPQGLVKTSTFRGEIYYKKEPVNGQIRESLEDFPTLSSPILGHLENIYHPLKYEVDSYPLPDLDSISNAFEYDPLHFHQKTPLSLIGRHMHGNIILSSDRSINVAASSILDRTLIIAPKVEIQSGFKGNVQIFATDTIILNEGVHLTYPSAIVVNQLAELPSVLNIGANCLIDGIVLSINETNTGRLSIAESALINGFVYTDTPCKLGGKIRGSTYAHGFVQQDASAIRHNLIYNGECIQNRQTPVFNYTIGTDSLSFIAWLK